MCAYLLVRGDGGLVHPVEDVGVGASLDEDLLDFGVLVHVSEVERGVSHGRDGAVDEDLALLAAHLDAAEDLALIVKIDVEEEPELVVGAEAQVALVDRLEVLTNKIKLNKK